MFRTIFPPKILHKPFKFPPIFFTIHTSTTTTKPLHNQEEEEENIIINSITNTLQKTNQPQTWQTLTKTFNSTKLTNPTIQKILLNLKQPINSKKALTFFHWSSKKSHFQHGISNYSIIIHILVKARLTRDAEALIRSILIEKDGNFTTLCNVLDSLIHTYVVVDSVPFVFDLFMQTCAKLRVFSGGGGGFCILDACKLLYDHGFSLSVSTFNALLHVLRKSSEVELVWGVYEHMVRVRVCPNEVTLRIMIGGMCKLGKLERFVCVLDRMLGKRCSLPRVIVNTCLVYEMAESGRIEDGLVLLKLMLCKDMILDTVSFCLVVFGKVKMGDLDVARGVYEEMLKRGFKENAFVCGLFVKANCEKGKIGEAIRLLGEMEELGFEACDDTYNHLIKGCSLDGRLEESLLFCEKMIRLGLVPCCSSVNEMFERLCENGKTKEADKMLTILLDKGFEPDVDTYSHLVRGYSKDGDMNGLMKLLFEMEYRSISPNLSGFNSLIISFCEWGRLEEAEKYFGIMKSRSFFPMGNVYERLVSANLEKGNMTRVNQLYDEMARTGCNSSHASDVGLDVD